MSRSMVSDVAVGLRRTTQPGRLPTTAQALMNGTGLPSLLLTIYSAGDPSATRYSAVTEAVNQSARCNFPGIPFQPARINEDIDTYQDDGAHCVGNDRGLYDGWNLVGFCDQQRQAHIPEGTCHGN